MVLRWLQSAVLLLDVTKSYKLHLLRNGRKDGCCIVNSVISVSPISSILLCSMAQERKVSSLQECVTAPTSPELVAKILALSSDRFTPAIEATSLISSSSL